MTFSNVAEFIEKYKNFIVFFIAVIVILIGIICVVNGQGLWIKSNYEKEAAILDSKYSKQYEAIIKPEGAKRITAILYELDKINNSQEKLNGIAEWEVRDFSSVYWGNKDPEPDSLYRYYDYGNGKIRAYTNNRGMSSPYKDNPYWMAYFRAGECEEKAALFEHIADRAGFTTRGVGYPGRHAWVEIKNISTGEWFYFDIDCYHNNLGDPLNSTRWYNQTKYYRTNCGLDFDSSVIVAKTGEDITKAYKIPEVLQVPLKKEFLHLPSIKENFRDWDDY